MCTGITIRTAWDLNVSSLHVIPNRARSYTHKKCHWNTLDSLHFNFDQQFYLEPNWEYCHFKSIILSRNIQFFPINENRFHAWGNFFFRQNQLNSLDILDRTVSWWEEGDQRECLYKWFIHNDVIKLDNLCSNEMKFLKKKKKAHEALTQSLVVDAKELHIVYTMWQYCEK